MPERAEIEAVAALRRIADGTWNTGTGRNLSAREFARDALARSPQGEDHEAKLEAIGTYLAQYPPSGFTDRYSAAGWSGIARGVLSAASVFGVSPSRDGTVAVEDTVARIVYFLRYVDWPDVTAADAVEREFGSARAGESKQNADGW